MTEHHTESTAIVIKLNEEKDIICFFNRLQDLDIHQTKPDSKNVIIMMFFDINHSF